MLISTALFASIVVAAVGALILWSNPSRLVNQVVFTCSLHWTLWLGFLHVAAHLNRGLFWLRLTCAVAAFLPIHFWCVKECIVAHKDALTKRWFLRSSIWVVISLALAALCFTDFFIPSHSSEVQRVRGWGYYTYIVGLYSAFAGVLYRTFKDTKALSGGRRLELQVWLIGGCATTFAILATMVLNAITKDRIYIYLQPLFVLIFYAGTAFAITTSRIFDANQILRVAAHRLALILIITFASYGVYRLVASFLPLGFAIALITVVAFVLVAALRTWFDQLFQFYPQANRVRKAAFDAAQREIGTEGMEASFLGILKGWGQTDNAIMLASSRGAVEQDDGPKSKECSVMDALRKFRWTTPERLARQRPTPEGAILREFLEERRLGVAVLSEGAVLSMIVGVGIPASRRAFTFPQVTQLTELSSIIENAFERTHLATKIQRTEQLVTVGLLGASVAHEIRNPLVSIKAIIQMLPTRYHEQAFREKFFQLISDEVVRIDRLTEQLLDLASPRAYTAKLIELHAVLHKALGLIGAKAGERRIQILTEFAAAPDQVFTDPAAVTQVALNLCLNAIQAMERNDGGEWIRIATSNKGDMVELSVSDNGPGITAEMRVRLFQPFQSTKSSGFGLGLSISRDILAGLHASIALDSAVAGQGATFRIMFPCRPLLS